MAITSLVSMGDDNGIKDNIIAINRFGTSYQELLNQISTIQTQITTINSTLVSLQNQINNLLPN